MEQPPYDLRQELNALAPESVHLYRDEFGDLALEMNGETYRPLSVVCAFPITAGTRFIALNDGEGHEIGIIRDVDELDGRSRKALASEMERAYFTPRITQVNDIQENFHIPMWDVETDRGHRVFEIRSAHRDVRVLSGGRILIRDADGNLYEIPNYRRLDPISRTLVEGQI